MSQILEQDVTESDDFYKTEIRRMIEQMRRNNDIIERDQEEIDWLKQKSSETLKRIDENLAKIEATLN
jgi:hypothetical protein